MTVSSAIRLDDLDGPSLSVSEVALAAGVNGSAVRFYEREGLITAVRTSGNQRRFDEQAACRIKVARVAQRIGLKVGEIRELLDDLPPVPTLEDWRRLHVALVTEGRQRIRELEQTLEAFAAGDKLCEL